MDFETQVQVLVKKRDVEGLIHELEGNDLWRLRVVIVALGRIGDFRAVEPLINHMKNNDADTRFLAAIALGKIGDSRGIEPTFGKRQLGCVMVALFLKSFVCRMHFNVFLIDRALRHFSSICDTAVPLCEQKPRFRLEM